MPNNSNKRPRDHRFIQHKYPLLYGRHPHFEQHGQVARPLQFGDMLHHMLRDGYLERNKQGYRLSIKGLAKQWELHGTHSAWEDLTDHGQRTYARAIIHATRHEQILSPPMGRAEVLVRIRKRMQGCNVQRKGLASELRGMSQKTSAYAKKSREMEQYTRLLSVYIGVIKGIEEGRFSGNE